MTGQIVLTSGGGDLNRYKSGTPVTLQRISGHRDGDATECPGTALYAQLPALRARAAAIAPAVAGRRGRADDGRRPARRRSSTARRSR